MTEDQISALERLAKLKAEGAISDADFEAQKARLMASGAAQVSPPLPPVLRRLWLVVTLTVTGLGFPIALAVLASGEVYRKVDGGWRPISRGARLTYAGFLALWLVAVLAKAIWHPGDWGTDTGTKTVQAVQTATTPPEKAPPDTAQPGNVTSATQPATEANTANGTQKTQDNAAGGQVSQTDDPQESRYSPQFHQCMAGEDAANGSTSAMMACTNQELNVQVAKLNETYKGLMTVLPADQRAQLRADQGAFIRQLETGCPEGDTEANGQLAMLDRPSCLLTKTIERTMALEKFQAPSGQQ